jgi:hypothetical protein
MTDYQRQLQKENRAWKRKNRDAIKTLLTKLLPIGGDRISPQPHPAIRFLATHGRLMEFHPKLREMEPSHCHANVAQLWNTRTPRSRLVAIATGYALIEGDGDGMWRPHSWALSRTKGVISIIETTLLRTKYFGIAYAPPEVKRPRVPKREEIHGIIGYDSLTPRNVRG